MNIQLHKNLKPILAGSLYPSGFNSELDNYLEAVLYERHETLPEKICLINYLPLKVTDQGEKNICVSICTSLIKTCHLKGEVEFDPLWNYTKREDPNSNIGMSSTNSLDIWIQKGGIPLTISDSFLSSSSSQTEQNLHSGWNQIAPNYKMLLRLHIYSIQGAKIALELGSPVLIVLPVYNASKTFWKPGSASEKILGAHAVTLCGYSNLNSSFLLRNSWGPQWGNRGYTDFPYADWDNYVEEAFTAFSDPKLCKSIQSHQNYGAGLTSSHLSGLSLFEINNYSTSTKFVLEVKQEELEYRKQKEKKENSNYKKKKKKKKTISKTSFKSKQSNNSSSSSSSLWTFLYRIGSSFLFFSPSSPSFSLHSCCP